MYRRLWEVGKRLPLPITERTSGKRKRERRDAVDAEDEEDGQEEEQEGYPGGGRKGVSSGLSTVVKKTGGSNKAKAKTSWWTELGNGSKGSVKLKMG